MIPDGEYTAVVDRIEDGLATLELTPVPADADACEDAPANDTEDTDAPADGDTPAADAARTDRERYSLTVPADDLPQAGRHADAVLAVTLVDEELAEVTHEPTETDRRQRESQDRFDRLSRRLSDDADEN